MDRGEYPKMRHHEDAVLGQPRDPFRLEGVDQHHRRLLHARGVGEDSARSNEQIESHVVDDRPVPRVLSEGVADRPLLLHSRQRRRELLVLDVREPQGLARDSLLEHQCFQRLWNRRRADHLVLHAGAQFAFVGLIRNPAQDHWQRRFGEDV